MIKIYNFLPEKYKNLLIIMTSKYFNKKYYIENYNLDKNVNPYKHYLNEGYKKGYNPSWFFDANKYLNENEDVKNSGMNPLVHYELYGKYEKRERSILYSYMSKNESCYKSKKVIRFFQRKVAELFSIFKIRKNRNTRILVYIHLFYINALDEIIEYLKNIEFYKYDLIISLTENNYDEYTIKEIKKFKENAKILVYENKGYDIGSFLETLKSINLDDYDIIYKLQSKGTKLNNRYVYGQFFRGRDWFVNLYQGILGPLNAHKTIDKLNSDKIGLVASKNLIINDPKHKKNLVAENLEKLGLKCSKDYKFVAGSCFAVKSLLLSDIQKLNLGINYFSDTKRGFFSRAHTMERYICISIINNHYEYYGNSCCYFRRLRWKYIENQLAKYSYQNLITDDYDISDDFVYDTLEGSFIKSYAISKIKLKNIKREWYGKIYSLKEVSPYKYLLGDKEKYESYCKFHEDNNRPNMSEKRYKELINSIEKNGFDERKIIVIEKNTNYILDGQHRCCYMLKKYGEDYKIRCLKIEFAKIDINKIKPSSKIKV